MKTLTYDQAYADHKFLWNISPASDMTGGYEDQRDLYKLLEKPTKLTARKCLQKQIEYWFTVGLEYSKKTYSEIIKDNPKVEDILWRYSPGEIWSGEELPWD